MKAIIFDMDGVLVDSEMHYINAMKKKLEGLNISYEDEFLYSLVGTSELDTRNMLDKLTQPQISGSDFMEEIYKDMEVNPIPYKELRMDGLYEVLTHFKSRGYKLAIASSSSREYIERMISENEIGALIDEVSSGHEYKESKPNPEIYIHTMNKIGIDPKDCIVVEDSPSGIAAGKLSGAYVIGICDKKFNMDQSKADVLVHSLWGIIDIVKELERV